MALDPAYLSAREEKPKLHVPVLAVAGGVEERLPDLILVLGMNLPKRVAPYDILAVSEQAAIGGVHVNPPALQVDQDNQVGGVLRNQAETLFGFGQIFRHLSGELERAAARGGQGIKDAEKEQTREHTAGQYPRGPEAVEATDDCVFRSAVLEFPDSARDFDRQRVNEGT